MVRFAQTPRWKGQSIRKPLGLTRINTKSQRHLGFSSPPNPSKPVRILELNKVLDADHCPDTLLFEFETENATSKKAGNDVPYQLQGNPDFDLPEVLVQRSELRNHPQIRRMIEQFWWLVDVNSTGSINKETYVGLLVAMQKALFSDSFDLEKATKQAHDDWEHDNKNDLAFTMETMHDSLFELADLWTDSLDVSDYVSFLRKLYYRVAAPGSPLRRAMTTVRGRTAEWGTNPNMEKSLSYTVGNEFLLLRGGRSRSRKELALARSRSKRKQKSLLDSFQSSSRRREVFRPRFFDFDSSDEEDSNLSDGEQSNLETLLEDRTFGSRRGSMEEFSHDPGTVVGVNADGTVTVRWHFDGVQEERIEIDQLVLLRSDKNTNHMHHKQYEGNSFEKDGLLNPNGEDLLEHNKFGTYNHSNSEEKNSEQTQSEGKQQDNTFTRNTDSRNYPSESKLQDGSTEQFASNIVQGGSSLGDQRVLQGNLHEERPGYESKIHENTDVNTGSLSEETKHNESKHGDSSSIRHQGGFSMWSLKGRSSSNREPSRSSNGKDVEVPVEKGPKKITSLSIDTSFQQGEDLEEPMSSPNEQAGQMVFNIEPGMLQVGDLVFAKYGRQRTEWERVTIRKLNRDGSYTVEPALGASRNSSTETQFIVTQQDQFRPIPAGHPESAFHPSTSPLKARGRPTKGFHSLDESSPESTTKLDSRNGHMEDNTRGSRDKPLATGKGDLVASRRRKPFDRLSKVTVKGNDHTSPFGKPSHSPALDKLSTNTSREIAVVERPNDRPSWKHGSEDDPNSLMVGLGDNRLRNVSVVDFSAMAAVATASHMDGARCEAKTSDLAIPRKVIGGSRPAPGEDQETKTSVPQSQLVWKGGVSAREIQMERSFMPSIQVRNIVRNSISKPVHVPGSELGTLRVQPLDSPNDHYAPNSRGTDRAMEMGAVPPVMLRRKTSCYEGEHDADAVVDTAGAATGKSPGEDHSGITKPLVRLTPRGGRLVDTLSRFQPREGDDGLESAKAQSPLSQVHGRPQTACAGNTKRAPIEDTGRMGRRYSIESQEGPNLRRSSVDSQTGTQWRRYSVDSQNEATFARFSPVHSGLASRRYSTDSQGEVTPRRYSVDSQDGFIPRRYSVDSQDGLFVPKRYSVDSQDGFIPRRYSVDSQDGLFVPKRYSMDSQGGIVPRRYSIDSQGEHTPRSATFGVKYQFGQSRANTPTSTSSSEFDSRGARVSNEQRFNSVGYTDNEAGMPANDGQYHSSRRNTIESQSSDHVDPIHGKSQRRAQHHQDSDNRPVSRSTRRGSLDSWQGGSPAFDSEYRMTSFGDQSHSALRPSTSPVNRRSQRRSSNGSIRHRRDSLDSVGSTPRRNSRQQQEPVQYLLGACHRVPPIKPHQLLAFSFDTPAQSDSPQ